VTRTSETLKKTTPKNSLERLLKDFLDFLPIIFDPVSTTDVAARSE